MSVLRILAGLALAVGVAAPVASAAPLEAYGKLPSIEAAGLSPDGQSVAYVVTDGEKRAIIVKDLTSGKFSFRAFTGDAKVRRVQWAGNDHLILMVTQTAVPLDVIGRRGEYAMAFEIDIRAGKLMPMMRDAGAEAMNIVLDTPTIRTVDGQPTVFVEGVSFVGGTGRSTLFRISLEHGSSKIVEIGGMGVRDWVLGADGSPVAQEVLDDRTGRWSLRVNVAGKWQEAFSQTSANDPPDLIGLGRDGKSVIYAARDEAQHWSWREARLDGAPAGPPIQMRGTRIAMHDPQDGRLVGDIAVAGDELTYTFYDPEDARAWKAVANAFPGDRVTLASWSADRKKIVVEVDSATLGPAYALVDLEKRSASWIGPEYGGVKPEDISPRQAVRYKAADGMEISGYLTLPRGKPAKGLPLVVFPHGGPASRDAPGFDWWAQAMASRGYAVLQPNFRGSDGLGEALLEAGYGQWGRKMQTDLSDGVRDLAAKGIIDPKRVCIVGASYGGYAALAGAALDPGVYRCAVSVAGPADLRRFVDWSKGYRGRSAYRYWTRFMGAEDSKDAALDQISPAAHADKVTIPVLIIHGKDDTVVPLEQSQLMADALRKAGKPVELVVQKGADHWLSRGDTRLETLTSTVAFLEKNNPPN